jgi:multidrug efflux pump subunit AcrA (membrane-fusion protein)
LLLLVLTVGLLGLAVMLVGNAIRQSLEPGGPARPAQERVVAANVIGIEPGVLAPAMTVYGKVEARHALEVRAGQGGTVIWVAEGFRTGGSVTAGEPILRLDPQPAEDALALAKADLAQATAAAVQAGTAADLAAEDLAAAEAQADLRRQALARQEDIAARGAGSAQAVETAALALSSAVQAVVSRKQALAGARAEVDQTAIAVTRAEIALAEAERALAETEVTAGLTGRVDAARVLPGAVIGANDVLGQIIDPTALDVAVRLSTTQFGVLADPEGQLPPAPARIALEEGTLLTGRIDRTAAAVGDGQTGRLVYVALDTAPGLAALKPGDFVTVTIEEPPLVDVALVPATAVGRQGTVLVLDPDNRLIEVPVSVLRTQGNDVILAAADLAGAEIVSERSAVLGEGIRIRPLRAEGDTLIPLTEAERARLTALVEADDSLAPADRDQLLRMLQEASVPAGLVAEVEGRADG